MAIPGPEESPIWSPQLPLEVNAWLFEIRTTLGVWRGAIGYTRGLIGSVGNPENLRKCLIRSVITVALLCTFDWFPKVLVMRESSNEETDLVKANLSQLSHTSNNLNIHKMPRLGDLISVKQDLFLSSCLQRVRVSSLCVGVFFGGLANTSMHHKNMMLSLQPSDHNKSVHAPTNTLKHALTNQALLINKNH